MGAAAARGVAPLFFQIRAGDPSRFVFFLFDRI